MTASDPVAKLKDATALASSDPAIITSVIGPDEIHLYESSQHHGNWLECVRSRGASRSRRSKSRTAPARRACCTTSRCAPSGRLYWDPVRERFKNDDAANALLSRPQRPPYVVT